METSKTYWVLNTCENLVASNRHCMTAKGSYLQSSESNSFGPPPQSNNKIHEHLAQEARSLLASEEPIHRDLTSLCIALGGGGGNQWALTNSCEIL